MLLQRYKFLSKSQLWEFPDWQDAGVYAIAKVQIFKQITTQYISSWEDTRVFMLLQRYKFLSKSQRVIAIDMAMRDVYAIAKVLIFKQITTKLRW